MSDPYGLSLPPDTKVEVIIGLEVHVQLQTESKMFSACGTEFGLPPNTQTDPVSLGLPGTLPVMNAKAFELALKTALAFQADIARFTKWDRKNYYYPDLPKNYQISQYDLPFSTGGALPIPPGKNGGEPRHLRLTRIHLEEDTGKLTHAAGGFTEVDLNRAGVPLLEIVTEPDLRSPEEAKACLEELRLTLRCLGVSDCEMQEGSLRCDANVNLHIHRDGQIFKTPIVEVKNLNSFRSVERALRYEVKRQYQAWLETGEVKTDTNKTTRGWVEEEGVTRLQRSKETAADYRYFPEPDLVPVQVDDAWLERIRRGIGELPTARRLRFEREYGLSAYDANVLVEQGQAVGDYFDTVAKLTGDPKLAGNWVQQDVLRVVKEQGRDLSDFPVAPEVLADLINRIKAGQLNTNQGREVFAQLVEGGHGDLDAVIQAGGYVMVSDRDAIVEAAKAALESNAKALADLKNGKKKPDAVKGFLRGQIMKQTGGKANPALVGEVLDELLARIESAS
ncbi:aspartyl/glutamyl-tRNA(Asn/Gln) amidotransferase subunit B [Isosphaera pallida ATCC 43644]|uniref:Aspartyl/glutamyl-tRNA(Asn/Gln) amidotransferase subunit B n=1 Tax=Isosphaera pallida (strain ATCC 43644 / DSM 9630 / IS1B) TaxID=575540 RepID=E8R261_ISOPI|nr:Asp-tRNA(Asn)/Glu-tRNA(Gln) amidotransferase subunit GatB [Isosphaera pallida]ADV63491.1 aspartyl/glutamyl-tRNA(Asn/Gln) amidotransferase subunit B [Isosphaera pallida ATCC 43644]